MDFNILAFKDKSLLRKSGRTSDKKPSETLFITSFSDHFPLNIQDVISGKTEIKEFIESETGRIINELSVFKFSNSDFINTLNEGTDIVINLHKINDIKHVNKYFESINSKLTTGGILIGCVETSGERKRRILNKFPRIISYPYYTFDFILKRVFPKWSFTKKIYFLITKGRNRVLSTTETLGRLYSCGYELLTKKEINNKLFFAVKKVSKPKYDMHPTYGPLVKMQRVGKDGKTIGVYKFRTMHPYAEYLQEYLFQTNNLKEGGKFDNDYRITTWGKIFRKLWIDELPMIINMLKGEMKLVGVRPLSEQYFNLYPKELREKRIKYKPGLVPPFYADMPKSFEDIVNSEKRYLSNYDIKPIRTDFKYFFRSLNNILIKRARSS
ncbi:hypothetical protein BH10BAC5_BH10BAC5_11620 [soil metagenome]